MTKSQQEASMKQLPESEVYERGLLYWPYKTSQEFVLKLVASIVPKEALLADLMCGPGNLLGRINTLRPDLRLLGMDIDPRYVEYGRTTYPQAEFEQGNILTWRPRTPLEAIVCTGALHHVPYELQEAAIKNIAAMAQPGKPVIIADCYLADYENEHQRRLAAAELGYEYLRATIENDAPDDVTAWTADILWNDVLMQEYKPSFRQRLDLLKRHFRNVETTQTWPLNNQGRYGDYIHLCTK